MKSIKEEMSYIRKRNKILNTFMRNTETLGFTKVESDLFEGLFDFLSMNKRFNVRDLVKVETRKGNLLVVRPDITTNIIKQVIPRITSSDLFKLYYLDAIYQFDSLGEMVETRQFGIEMIGGSSVANEIELLSVLEELLSMYNVTYYLEVGNQLFIDLLIKQISSNEEVGFRLKNALMSKNLSLLDEVIETKTIYTQLLYMVLNPSNDIELIKQYIIDNNLDKRLLEELLKTIDFAQAVRQYKVTLDMSLVSPFDYYNGFIFKGYIDGYNKDVFRGGRYDTLTKQYGKLTKAIGFSLDMDVLINEVIHCEK